MQRIGEIVADLCDGDINMAMITSAHPSRQVAEARKASNNPPQDELIKRIVAPGAVALEQLPDVIRRELAMFRQCKDLFAELIEWRLVELGPESIRPKCISGIGDVSILPHFQLVFAESYVTPYSLFILLKEPTRG